jgi:hypothetical protein
MNSVELNIANWGSSEMFDICKKYLSSYPLFCAFVCSSFNATSVWIKHLTFIENNHQINFSANYLLVWNYFSVIKSLLDTGRSFFSYGTLLLLLRAYLEWRFLLGSFPGPWPLPMFETLVSNETFRIVDLILLAAYLLLVDVALVHDCARNTRG